MAKVLDPAKQNKGKRHWNMPNIMAHAKLLAGGDLRAALLLYRILQVWGGTKKS